MTEPQYDGLLLDHDGVLVTLCSRQALRAAATAAFDEAGVSDPSGRDVDTITIRVDETELCAVADRHGIDPDRLWECREAQIERTLRRATRTGAKVPYDDVGCLDRVTVPIGIVSNNQRRIVEFVLREHGLSKYVETIRARPPTRASLRKKKPDPTYLDAAAADLGCSNPLYVGDSESDVVAGQRAGVDTLFLRRDHNASRYLDAEPIGEIEGLDAVLEFL